MVEEMMSAWRCPRDGTAMQPRGHRQGAWRCPECRGLFLDAETWRGYRERHSARGPVLVILIISLLATIIVRQLRRRPMA